MWPAPTQLGAACRRLLNRSAPCDIATTSADQGNSPVTPAGDPTTCWPLATEACEAHLSACSTRFRCRRLRCKSVRSACTKSYLVLVNFSFLLCGLILSAIGLWLYVNQDSIHYARLLHDNQTGPLLVFDKFPFVCLVAGLALTVVSFLGCCGACTESVCFLSFYSLMILIIVVTQLVAGILFISFRLHITSTLHASLHYQLIHEYNKTAESSNKTSPDTLQLTAAWDRLQTEWHCCGVLGPQDYITSSWLNNTPVTEAIFVPPSCCVTSVANEGPHADRDVGDRRRRKHQEEQQPVLRHGRRHQRRVTTSWAVLQKNYCQIDAIMFPSTVNHSEYLHTRGCQTVVVEWFHQQSRQSWYWLTVIVCLQCTGLLCSCALITWLRKRLSDYWWCEEEECVEYNT